MLEAYLERCSQTQKLQQNTYVRELRLHVLTGDVAKDNIEELSKYLPSTRHGIATDRAVMKQTNICQLLLDMKGQKA